MRNLSINDCGTAHEDKLLEIYNQFIENEKIRKGKEPTEFEKSELDMQIAMAYQSILTNLKDGVAISQALNLLEERVSTISIREISKVAVDVVNEVYEDSYYTSVNMKNNEEQVASAILLNDAMNGLLENNEEFKLVEMPEDLGKFNDAEIANNYAETNNRAKAGDENALVAKGLMTYAMQYINVTKMSNNTGNRMMILGLINDLTTLDDPAAMSIALKLSEVYKLDVISVDENGNKIADSAKINEMYREGMLQINPNKADEVVSVLKNKREYLVELGRNSAEKFEELLNNAERETLKIAFNRKYKNFIDNGQIEMADELVRQYPDIAKEIIQENIPKFENAQQTGNKKYARYLQTMNKSLSNSISKLPKNKPISARRVKMENVVSEVVDNTTLIKRNTENEREF